MQFHGPTFIGIKDIIVNLHTYLYIKMYVCMNEIAKLKHCRENLTVYIFLMERSDPYTP